MTPNSAFNQYRENSIMTASPEDLTLMLYNGLIKFIMQAQAAVDENITEKAHNSIVRAQDIIREFQRTLDTKYEVSKGLELLYDYMQRRLIEANIKKDAEILQEVLDMARELRDTWAQAMKIARQQPKVKKAVGSEV